MTRKERNKLLSHSNRTYSWTAASVWNAECLVEIQVANVSSDVSRAGESYLCIHVSAVHVHLPTILVDHIADLRGHSPDQQPEKTSGKECIRRGGMLFSSGNTAFCTSTMDSSKTPWVEGYVIISAASSFLCFSAAARRASTSTLPAAERGN